MTLQIQDAEQRLRKRQIRRQASIENRLAHKAREREEIKAASQTRREAGIRQVERTAAVAASATDLAAPHMEVRDGVRIWVKSDETGRRLSLPYVSIQHGNSA